MDAVGWPSFGLVGAIGHQLGWVGGQLALHPTPNQPQPTPNQRMAGGSPRFDVLGLTCFEHRASHDLSPAFVPFPVSNLDQFLVAPHRPQLDQKMRLSAPKCPGSFLELIF